MKKKDFASLISNIEKENQNFTDKSSLSTLNMPSSVVGRKKQIEELLRILLDYKKGFVVPFVSVYGRSGSGKSTVVKFVCQNLKDQMDIDFCFANLRKAKTVFGAANIILGEMGHPTLKSAQGINSCIDKIVNSISDLKNNLFVLMLDEFDVLFSDKRGRPSDFLYKLITMSENLQKNGILLCIVGIANNVILEYDLDDRVRSRIGSSEIFFEPYSEVDLIRILQDRSKHAFSKKISKKVIGCCAKLGAEDHGDARRAVDLLRVSAEVAAKNHQSISEDHVNAASAILQKDRIDQILSESSFQFKVVCSSIARLSYLLYKEWHSTSSIFDQYKMLVGDKKSLTYRRISEILTEIGNTGLTISQTSSKGRRGYGTQFKLTVMPEMVGNYCFPEWWKKIKEDKQKHLDLLDENRFNSLPNTQYEKNLNKRIDKIHERMWKKYAGSN